MADAGEPDHSPARLLDRGPSRAVGAPVSAIRSDCNWDSTRVVAAGDEISSLGVGVDRRDPGDTRRSPPLEQAAFVSTLPAMARGYPRRPQQGRRSTAGPPAVAEDELGRSPGRRSRPPSLPAGGRRPRRPASTWPCSRGGRAVPGDDTGVTQTCARAHSPRRRLRGVRPTCQRAGARCWGQWSPAVPWRRPTMPRRAPLPSPLRPITPLSPHY